ncbi:hypothetical protein G8T71_10590 [Clostridium botulinum C/D]|uniref:hypothetical protein n=1 Tax=Clostridium botulinum TaxID=1491 RepID=UPI001E315238|nr:hypothetical protein [Clostridium botulinum]MCD3211802.1 hypothetical protein [Clostridium botulinum C/D]
MSKIDISTVYKERIEEIEKQQKQLIYKKNWAKFYELKAEKEKLEQILSEF